MCVMKAFVDRLIEKLNEESNKSYKCAPVCGVFASVLEKTLAEMT